MIGHNEEGKPFILPVRDLLKKVSNRISSSEVTTELLETPGLHLLQGGPESRKTLTLIDGLACAASAHNRLLNEIHIGRLVKPLPPEVRGAPILSVNAVTLTTVRAFRGTLLGILAGGIKNLVSTLLEAPYRRCPECGRRIFRYTRINQIIEDLFPRLQNEEIAVTLHGPEEDLRRFSDNHGFSMDHTHGKAIVFLDSLRFTSTTIRRLERALSLTRPISTCWIVISSSKGEQGYSENGYCDHCLLPGRTIDPREVEAEIKDGPTISTADSSSTPSSVVKLLELGSSTLEEVFKLSIEDASTSLTAPLPLVSAASASGFGNVRLSQRFETLSIQARLALTAIVALESHSDIPISVIDLPIVLGGLDWSPPLQRKLADYAVNRSIVIAASEITAPTSTPNFKSSSLSTLSLDSLRSTQPSSLRFTSPLLVVQTAKGLNTVDLFDVLSHSNDSERPIEALALLKTYSMSRSMVIEELDLYDRLARLFAASIRAKSLGLTPSSFKRTTIRANHTLVCPTCRGLGLLLQDAEIGDRPSAAICITCKGSRFAPPLNGITFKGTTLPALLNSTIGENLALLRALPRAAATLDLLNRLGLTHLPLGMPLALLSFSESRLLRFVTALTTTRRAGDIVLIEEPFAGLSTKQRHDLHAVFSEFAQGPQTYQSKASFILIGNDPGLCSLGPVISIINQQPIHHH